MELKDTIELMESNDYKDRFKAEYYQVKIRKEKLQKMVDNWEHLSFNPDSPKHYLDFQCYIMLHYIKILEQRAEKENIDLGDETHEK